MPVDCIFGGIGAVFAGFGFFEFFSLRGGALQLGPSPSDEGNALAIGKPFEVDHAGGNLACAFGFTTIWRNEVELGLVVLLAILLALGHKCHPISLGRKLWATVFVATLRKLSWLSA